MVGAGLQRYRHACAAGSLTCHGNGLGFGMRPATGLGEATPNDHRIRTIHLPDDRTDGRIRRGTAKPAPG